jgi:hypothetical protein
VYRAGYKGYPKARFSNLINQLQRNYEGFGHHTLGIAYTKLPSGAEVEDSDVEVVRKINSEVPLLVSCR